MTLRRFIAGVVLNFAHKTTTTCCSHRCANALYKKKKRDEVIKTNNLFTEKIVLEKPIEKVKKKPFLTITEAAVYLDVTRPTLYSYLKNGELKASRLGCKYLLRKEDIDELFNHPTEFRIQPKERTTITEFYTTAEVKEKYNVVDSWIFVVAKKHNIPRVKVGKNVKISRPELDQLLQMYLWRGECGSVQTLPSLLTERQAAKTYATQSFTELRHRLLLNFQRVTKNSLSG